MAPSPRSIATAEPLAIDSRWSGVGCDERALWGRCRGGGAEPYETAVDHVEVAWRCTCPSRKLPCKHAIALLLMWVRGLVAEAALPARVAMWIDARDRRPAASVTAAASAPGGSGCGDRTTAPTHGSSGENGSSGESEHPNDRGDLDRSRDDRVARMNEGLHELDRWLEDRIRTGLADPMLARYTTWDALAARLVDARAGALGNRVRRLAGLVGAGIDWHSEVLAELGILHLIAQAGRRLQQLPGPLADAVATASGWQVRQADVLLGVPDTDDWFVAGRSDAREDRIEVRRVWLRGNTSGRWAMLLSFAAYHQTLDESFVVGTVVRADVHRYPGGSLRSLVGRRYGDPLALLLPATATTVADACDAIGAAIAAEPWLERFPATVTAAPTISEGRWLLSDATGSLALLGDVRSLGTLAAASAAVPISVTVEWTPRGVIPLTLHLPDRSLDIGPRADPSFVGAA